ncbi:hypothetical protein V1477_017536 [Vespula maculifrons]|uniref:Uncharacterized protein n=2 Tax=Vespula TaxID=7451 RepID=A0A834K8N5_VESVU|nr:hypothetical protein HZH66_005578 [Vespula vulgaris]
MSDAWTRLVLRPQGHQVVGVRFDDFVVSTTVADVSKLETTWFTSPEAWAWFTVANREKTKTPLMDRLKRPYSIDDFFHQVVSSSVGGKSSSSSGLLVASKASFDDVTDV